MTTTNTQGAAYAALPEGWAALTITHEGQYPEEVAYGPQIMMDRLGKWLAKYFAQTAQADSVQEDAALLHYALSDGGNQSMNWQDIFDDWDGDGYFIDALRAARKQGEKQ